MSLACPRCKEETQVLDTREVVAVYLTGKPGLRRRRKCLNQKCAQRFTTYEVLTDDVKQLRRDTIQKVGKQLASLAGKMLAGTLDLKSKNE